MQQHELVTLANARMPFGKYKGTLLIYLREDYLVWMKQKGWPDGKIGKQLQMVHELKMNGLESLILPLIDKKL
jgi:uncharacterized protein (DUF3820 family)